jgi:hypothetical protein
MAFALRSSTNGYFINLQIPKVLAVVVFFMSKTRSPDARLIEQTEAIVSHFQQEYLSQLPHS